MDTLNYFIYNPAEDGYLRCINRRRRAHGRGDPGIAQEHAWGELTVTAESESSLCIINDLWLKNWEAGFDGLVAYGVEVNVLLSCFAVPTNTLGLGGQDPQHLDAFTIAEAIGHA